MRDNLPKNKQLVSISKAAEILGVSIDTIRRWDKSGDLKSQRPNGKDRYFSVEELESHKFSKPLSISQASEQLGISTTTLRRLEEKGLIKPQRNANGERMYDKDSLEKFLHSEYFMREKQVQEKILEPLTPPDKEDLQPKKEVDEKQNETLHVINSTVQSVEGKIGSVLHFQKAFYGSGLFLATTFTFLVIIITALFLLFPSDTAKFFGYNPKAYKELAVGGQVLGAKYPTGKKVTEANLVGKVLKPLSNVSLSIVKEVNPLVYEQIVPLKPIEDVNDVFGIDKEGNLTANFTFRPQDSSYLKIPDKNLIKNLNAELIQGRAPGGQPGDLVVIGERGLVSGVFITSSNILDGQVGTLDLADESVTTAKLVDGTITAEKLASGVVATLGGEDSILSKHIKNGEVKGQDIDSETITTGNLSSTLTFSDGDYLNLSAILHDDVNLQGLRLPNTASATPISPTSGEGYLAWDATGNQLIVYNGSAWTATGGNAFGTFAVSGQSNVAADSITDTLILAAGANITLTTDASTDTITIAASGGTLTVEEGDAGGFAATTMDFLAGDFVISNSPSGEANVSLDYPNSKITRSDQIESISGAWSFTGNITANDASADTILIGQSGATDDTITIAGDISLTDDQWSITAGGVASLATDETINGIDISSGSISDLGGLSLNAGANLTFASGTGKIDQTLFTGGSGSIAYDLNVTNTSTDGTSITGIDISLSAPNGPGFTNVTTGINFPNISSSLGSLYGFNFGTGFTDILRYNNEQIISGTGILQSAGLSGTYSNALTLSGATNSITVGTLTATGGTINGISIGVTTPSTGAFTTLSATGDITANDASADTILIGQSGATDDTVTIAGDISLTDDQWSITAAGVGSLVTGTVIGSQTFTTNNIVDSGALTIKSAAGANALTLDSGTTGGVNLGTGNNAKTIAIGTGTAGNTINIGTNNTTLDAINIGSVLDDVAITGDQWSITNAGALTVVSCTGCGGGGATLQSAYDTTSGNTILTTTARNIAFTLGEVVTPTSLTLENQDTAGVSAQRIFNSIATGTLTNGLFIEQTGAGALTNAINITGTAGAITNGILIADGAGTIANGIQLTGTFTTTLLDTPSLDISGAGAITGATGVTTTTLDVTGNITANDASADTILIGQSGATDDTVTIAGDISLTDDQWSITAAGVGSLVTGTVIGSQTFTTNNIVDSGALTITSTTNALTLDSGSGSIALSSDSLTGVGTGITANAGLTINTAGTTGTMTLRTADQSGGSTNSTALNILTGNAAGATSTAGNIVLDVGTSTTSNGSILIGTAARAQTITIGNSTGGVITIGQSTGSGLVLNDAQWSVSDAGAAAFASVSEGGTALSSKYAPIAANFVTVTSNATLTGETGIDALSTAISTSSTLNVDGASTLAGVTMDAGSNFTMTSGTGLFAQTHAVTTDATVDAHTITLSAGGTGETGALRGLVISQSDTATTGVYDSLASIINLKTPETTTNGLLIQQNAASGTLTNALHITNTAGTLTSAIVIDGTAPGSFILDTPSLDISGAGAITGATGVTTTTLDATGNITANDASADTILIGQSGATDDTVTIAGDISLTDDQWSITAAGVGSLVTGTVIGSQTFTTNNIVDSGALTIKSAAGANALTLDSGTTGGVNLGTGNNAKTIAIGTGTAGNTINIGTNNTTLDAINIGSVLDDVAITGDQWSITNAGALTVVSCTGCGGGGATLQSAYDTTSGNTILTTTARNIAFTLGEVVTPTSLTLENQDTAGVSAQRIFNSIATGTLTNGLFIEQTGAGALTNAINITGTAGAITNGILIADGAGTIANGIQLTGTFTTTLLDTPSLDISGAGAITGATGVTTTTLDVTGNITANDASADTILIGQSGATDDTVTIAGDISLTDDQWSITAAGVGSLVTGTVIGSQTFTTNNIVDSGALTITSTTNALTLDSGSGSIALSSDSLTGVGTGITANAGLTINTAGTTGTMTLRTADQSGGSTNSTALNIITGNAAGATSTAGNIVLDVGTSTTSNGSILIGTAARAQTITIGNSTGGAVRLGQNGGTVQIDGTDFDVSTSGDITVGTGNNAATRTISRANCPGFAGCDLTIRAGDTTDGNPGVLTLQGGSVTGASAIPASGVSVLGGTGSATGAGGPINLTTGAGGVTSGNSGALTLLSGNTTSGTAGNISINVGTSTTSNGSILIGTAARAQTITIGNSTGGAVRVGQNGGTLQLDGTNFDVSTAGVVTLVGGLTADITTASTAGGTNLTIAPSSPSSSGAGKNLVLKGSDFTTSGSGGAVTITGGAASGNGTTGGAITVTTGAGGSICCDGSGALTLLTGNAGNAGIAGNISIDVGTSSSGNGSILIGTAARAQTITIGNSTGGVITIGQSTGSGLVLNDAQWSVSDAGAAAFASVSEGGTALSSKYAPIAANFVTVTSNATLTGETGIDALSTAISTSSTLNVDGASTLAGVTLDANANLALAAGTGTLTINSTVTSTDDALLITPSYSGTTGSNTYNLISTGAFTAANSTGTDTVNALSIGNLTESGVGAVTSTALKIGTGWDNIWTSANTSLTTAGALTVVSCTGCGGGGATLQSAYDTTSGNTILTTTARNIAFTLGEVVTPTSLTLENQDTAGVSAQRIFNSIATGTLTNGLFIEQTGAGALTNAINITGTAGAITNGILIADGAGTIANGIQLTGTFTTTLLDTPSLDISGAGAITGATGVTTTTLDVTGNITANDASADTILIGQSGATDDTVTIAGDISLTDDQWSITAAGVGSLVTGTVIGSQTFTTNNIVDSGALTITSTTNALTLDSGSGSIALSSDSLTGVGTGITANAGLTINTAGTTGTMTLRTADQSGGSTNSTALNILTGNAAGATSTAGNIVLDVGTSTTSNGSILIGTAARAQTITIGNSTGGVITIGQSTGSGLVLNDAQWSVSDAGAAAFASVSEGGTALSSKYAPIAANFVTVTSNATLTGETGIDALSTAISTSSTLNVDGASTLAGVTMDAGSNFTMTSGTGLFAQTHAVTTDATVDAHTITLSAGGTGETGALRGLVISQSDTATTGVYDSLASIINLKTPETTTNGLLIQQNAASGTLTNGINITNTAGSLTTGISMTGTFTNYIDTLNFDVSNAGGITMAGVLAVNGDSITADGATLTINAGGTVDIQDALSIAGALSGVTTLALSGDITWTAATPSIDITAGEVITIGDNGVAADNITLDTTNNFFRVGDATNGITFDVDANTTIFAGTTRPSKVIVLSPEYTGASLSADGSITTAGSMTSDNELNATAAKEWKNFYKWTSTNAANQDYTVMVRITLPQDFDTWETGACPGATCALELAFATGLNATTNNAVSVIVNNAADTPGTAVCTVADSASATNDVWTSFGCAESTLNDAVAPEWDAAGETAVLRIKLKANSTASALAKVGDITLRYKARF